LSEKMRKVLFLMFLLLLMGLGAAGVKAQVRIGGNGAPQGAAVLDLNADDTATPTANKGALALPRVSLASNTAQLNGTAPITGMLVYNTNASMTGGNGVGMYFWDGSAWVMVAPYSASSPNTYLLMRTLDTTFSIVATPQHTYGWINTPTVKFPAFCETNTAIYTLATQPGELLLVCIQSGGCPATAVHAICYTPVIAH